MHTFVKFTIAVTTTENSQPYKWYLLYPADV